MKVLVLLLVLGVLVWLWRSGRRADASGAARPKAVTREDMLACALCGTHVPRSEALPGPGDLVFCGEPHRLTYEQAHSGPP